MDDDMALPAHGNVNLTEAEKAVHWFERAHHHSDRADAAEAEVERLREIERVFNKGWLPPIRGDGASLKIAALSRLRELIPHG